MSQDFVAHPALLDLHHRERQELPPQSTYLDLRVTEEIQETKATKAIAPRIYLVTKVNPALLDQEVNLARMEMTGRREKKASLDQLDTLVPRVKREKEDLQVMVMVPLALLVLVVYQGYKEKKVIMVLRERQVHQAGTWKDLEERGVRRETLVRKETGV